MVQNVLSNKNMVKMSNKLNVARYTFNSKTLNILYVLFAQIGRDDQVLKKYEVNISDIEDYIFKTSGVNMRYNKKDLELVARDLVGATIDVLNNIDEKGNKDYNIVVLCPSINIKEKERILTIKFNDELEDYLLNRVLDMKKQFTLVNNQSFLKLKGQHTKRIYTLLSQFSRSKDKYIIFKLDDFIDTLKLPDYYKEFKKLKSKIILPSIKEINDKSDFKVSYNELKKGRSVTHIEFKLEKNKSDSIDDWLKS